MSEGAPKVARLGQADGPEVVDVLCEAFFDYPVMRFVLGPDEGAYEERLRVLVGYFVSARVHRDELLLGVGGPDRLSAAALVSRPGRESRPELAELRERVWAELGAEAHARYGAFAKACAPFEAEAPHIHLNMIGVRRSARGEGLGRALLEGVHRLSEEDPESTGVSLTTEMESNVPLYEHFGYQLVGRERVAPELTTWGFFRPDLGGA